jgi:FkbM family methyltransferase
VCVGDVALVVHENGNGGTAQDAAVEAISDYGLDKIDLKAGEVVVDVGANVGVVSLYLAKKFPEAQIIAVEPHPQTFEYLKLNIKANGCENITALNYAVNADGGFVRLGGDVDENAGGVHMFGDGEEVTAVPLAHVFAHHAEGKRVALLKLDCEGAEWGVLRSSLDVLDEVDRIRGELHVNQQLLYDMTLIDRVVGLVPDTVWTGRIIADFTPQTPPLAPPRRQGGESARQEQVGQAGLDKERYPVVTVLIPTLNGADTITKAIESVLTPPLVPPRRQGGESARQEQGEQVERVGLPLVEVVVVDDGSTDETVHIVRSLREKYANLVLVEMLSNAGQVAAMNAGLRAARGEWVLFIGDDDVVDAEGLREMIDQLQAWDNTIGFVYSDYQYMGKRTDRVHTPPFRRADYHRHFAAGAACMWRRAIGLEYRTLHDGKHAHGEDFDLIYRLVEMGYAGKKLPTVKPVVHLNLVDGRGTSWLHQHQDEGALAEFKRRHPQFRGRL